MIHYRVFYSHAHRHFISFEATFKTNGNDVLQLQLPSWRPGRYELGNFAKNIRCWKARTNDGKPITFQKRNKDLWEVNVKGVSEVVVEYQYYASELNAGSSYLDDQLLYINPVNCFFYDVAKPEQEFKIDFELPSNYRIATGMRKLSEHSLHADSFDNLADCPLIASASLNTLSYEAGGKNYYMHFQGEVKLDMERLVKEFRAFTLEQLALFGDIPCEEYHFLFHFLPYFVRHGVEHCNSTVIAMGPAADFQQESLFKDLLGISCHELFHTWNIKSIRPVEMMPYNFTGENYNQSGFVAEGVTTYYGDYLLWRTGSFNNEDWFEVLNDTIQTHFDNPGRLNYSVAESSFDTWLDGYSPGIPWRKVSIYNEGFLIALICDIHIRSTSGGKLSLDDLMKNMYIEFGKTGRGYTTEDYCALLKEYGGSKISQVIDSIIFGKENYKPFLQEALGLLGLNLTVTPSMKFSESTFGLMVEETNTKITVQSVVENSPADLAGLWAGDEIIALDGTLPYKNFQLLLKTKQGKSLWTILRKNKLVQLFLEGSNEPQAFRYKVTPLENPSEEMSTMFNAWKKSMHEKTN